MLLGNVVDVDLCIVGAMTVLLTEAFPSFHLKGNDFVTLHMFDDLRFDNSLDILTNGQVVAMSQEDLSKFNFITGVSGNPGDVERLVLLDLELLTGYFHNC